MQAAERIFDGAFDDVTDDGDVNMAEAGSSKAASSKLAVREAFYAFIFSAPC